MYMHTHKNVWVCVYVCMYVRDCARVRVLVCVCTHIYVSHSA